MAQVVGQLRADATSGEILVLDRLKTNLPKDVTVYVETPIYLPRKASHPDFIILTNYGFVILEVKDWRNFIADRHFAYLKTREGEKRHSNPVTQARDYALDLTNVIGRLAEKKKTRCPRIPYGYAVVFPFFPGYEKTSLQDVWGESFVLLQEDLNSHLINRSIRNTIREDKISPITKETMDLVRGAINPEITTSDGVILDEEQSKLVLETPGEEVLKTATTPAPKKPKLITQALFDEAIEEGTEDNLTSESEQIISGNSVRLLRGVMGSGKTLVLLGKAKRWSKINPDWDILVLSYNKELAQSLRKELRGYPSIKTSNLDQLLRDIITAENRYLWTYPLETRNWVENHKDQFEIVQNLGADFVSDELKWIQEVMVSSREEYLNVKRVGRGNRVQISQSQRNDIYDLLEAQYSEMQKKRQISWELLYLKFLEWVDSGEIEVPQYDAILIDEAQDFAPSWIAIVNKLLKPDGNLFMVDDPTQSIFRYFTWRQRGVEVVGRTKYLKLPYRNTIELYSACQAIIKDDPQLMKQLESEGEEFLTQDDLSSMRNGERPLLVTIKQQGKDIEFVESQIQLLKHKKGITFENMCVILPSGREARRFSEGLATHPIKVITANQMKGLTFEVVFLCGLDHYFRNGSEDDLAYISHQKRLIYSCMGRARQLLYLLHHNKISPNFKGLRDFVDFYEFS
ncbi:MAG: UvrD-helicase domain-containing protein [Chloroflexi bacterium]|nr:UvrD-helicase domain-containing protein [Chloroflexota bacterium]